MRKVAAAVLAEKYHIQSKQYFYTVSSLAKHKNLITLLKMIKLMKDEGESPKLVITGVKVNAADEIMQYIADNDLKKNVIYTGFISNEDRNALYDNCKVFLFPSVFEGFGMPPVEAMLRNVPVVTTKATSIYEVTQGKASYIENWFDENEWMQKTCGEVTANEKLEPQYNMSDIVNEYLQLFKEKGL